MELYWRDGRQRFDLIILSRVGFSDATAVVALLFDTIDYLQHQLWPFIRFYEINKLN